MAPQGIRPLQPKQPSGQGAGATNFSVFFPRVCFGPDLGKTKDSTSARSNSQQRSDPNRLRPSSSVGDRQCLSAATRHRRSSFPAPFSCSLYIIDRVWHVWPAYHCSRCHLSDRSRWQLVGQPGKRSDTTIRLNLSDSMKPLVELSTEQYESFMNQAGEALPQKRRTDSSRHDHHFV